jgi:hypothetical protein
MTGGIGSVIDMGIARCRVARIGSSIDSLPGRVRILVHAGCRTVDCMTASRIRMSGIVYAVQIGRLAGHPVSRAIALSD